jgi:hypothetical protein
MRVNTFEKQVRVRTADGTIPRIVNAPVAASAAIKMGDILAISSGQVAQAIALPGSDSTETSAGGVTLYGVAMADVTTGASVNEATDRIPVAVFDDNLEVALKIHNATASSAEPRDLTVATAYSLGRWRGASADVWWYFVDTSTTNGEMRYVERTGNNDEDYGLVWCKCVSTYRAAG